MTTEETRKLLAYMNQLTKAIACRSHYDRKVPTHDAPHMWVDIPCQRVEEVVRFTLGMATGKDFVWEGWMSTLSKYVHDNKGRNLLLYGIPGVGKTLMAQYILVELYSKLYGRVLNFYPHDVWYNPSTEIYESSLKVIDDLGAEHKIGYADDRYYAFCDILDHAISNKQMLIITSNYTKDLLGDIYGDRVKNRILKFKKIACIGECKRRNEEDEEDG